MGLTSTRMRSKSWATAPGVMRRHALNTLEVAALLASGEDRSTTFDTETSAEALQRRIVRYDKAGDQHYDIISAFIKSVRGSDPDAALYWLTSCSRAARIPSSSPGA